MIGTMRRPKLGNAPRHRDASSLLHGDTYVADARRHVPRKLMVNHPRANAARGVKEGVHMNVWRMLRQRSRTQMCGCAVHHMWGHE